MSKKIEREIVELIKKWYQYKVVFPSAWSDERTLSSKQISYKTYDSGRIDYVNIELSKDSEVWYKLLLRNDRLEIEKPLTLSLSARDILADLTYIYTEATSIESQVEGAARMRQKIRDLQKEIRSRREEVRKLKLSLKDEVTE